MRFIIFIIMLSLLSLPSVKADTTFFDQDDAFIITQSTTLVVIFNFNSIAFATLAPGSNNSAILSLGNTSISVTTNCPYEISGNATQFTDGSSHNFDQSNLTIDTNETDTNLSIADSISMTSSPQIIDTDIQETVSALYVGAWLSIPAKQYPANYSNTLTLTVSNV